MLCKKLYLYWNADAEISKWPFIFVPKASTIKEQNKQKQTLKRHLIELFKDSVLIIIIIIYIYI